MEQPNRARTKKVQTLTFDRLPQENGTGEWIYMMSTVARIGSNSGGGCGDSNGRNSKLGVNAEAEATIFGESHATMASAGNCSPVPVEWKRGVTG